MKRYTIAYKRKKAWRRIPETDPLLAEVLYRIVSSPKQLYFNGVLMKEIKECTRATQQIKDS